MMLVVTLLSKFHLLEIRGALPQHTPRVLVASVIGFKKHFCILQNRLNLGVPILKSFGNAFQLLEVLLGITQGQLGH